MDGWFFSKRPNLWCRWAQSSLPPSPPSSSQRQDPTPPHAPTPSPSLDGFIRKKRKKKKIKFGFWGLAFQMVLRLIWWGQGGRWGSEYWYPFSCKNRGVKGHYQLFVEGEPEGGWPWPLLTSKNILNAVTCEVYTAHTSFVGVGGACGLQLIFKLFAECHIKINFICHLWSEKMKKS